MENVTITWTGENRFALHHTSYEELGPKQFLLLALGKCAALTLLALLGKMHVQQTALRIDTRGELSGPQELAYTQFTSFRQTFHLDCPAKDRDQALHALRLTHDKYCGVSRMLSHVAPISCDVVLNGSPESL